MFGTKSRLNNLALRKQLLLAESEVNRVQFANEWHNLVDETREATRHARSVMSSVAATVSMGIAGFKTMREMRSNGKATSWVGKLLGGVRLGSALWKAFRSSPK